MYPEYADAVAEIAAFFDVSTDEFTLTNGTDEAIQLMMNTFVNPQDDVLMMRPSYAMYRFYAELAGANVREIEYDDDFRFPIATFHGRDPRRNACDLSR